MYNPSATPINEYKPFSLVFVVLDGVVSVINSISVYSSIVVSVDIGEVPSKTYPFIVSPEFET